MAAARQQTARPRPDMPSRPPGGGPGPSPINPAQGPIAMGEIVYAQDFEENTIGITLSPNNLPPERAVVVDDPLEEVRQGHAGHLAGGGQLPHLGRHPAAQLDLERQGGRLQIQAGTKVSIAWAQMFDAGATSRPSSPRPSAPARCGSCACAATACFNILCNQCGGNTEHMTLEANRWYDFRVDMDWMGGGAVRFYVDDQMVHQSHLGGVSAPCHWDGGIYNTPAAPP